MAQIYMFKEELGKAVKSCKCHLVNKKIFSSKDKKKLKRGGIGQVKRKSKKKEGKEKMKLKMREYEEVT